MPRFCLQLDKRSKSRVKEFLQLNWLNFHDRNLQLIVSDIFKTQNDQCPDSFDDERFSPIGENAIFSKNKTTNPKLVLFGT